jgi:hypothetical protein
MCGEENKKPNRDYQHGKKAKTFQGKESHRATSYIAGYG